MIIFAFGLIHQAEVAAWSDTSFILEDSVSVVLLSACRGQLSVFSCLCRFLSGVGVSSVSWLMGESGDESSVRRLGEDSDWSFCFWVFYHTDVLNRESVSRWAASLQVTAQFTGPTFWPSWEFLIMPSWPHWPSSSPTDRTPYFHQIPRNVSVGVRG